MASQSKSPGLSWAADSAGSILIVDDNAETIGVSEDYLTRVFNRELEISPWDYLSRYRILQAQALLKNTAGSIAEIAHQVGFKDQAYFSRVFSKQVGVSPNEFKNG